jgi:hypothetical protein
MDETPEKVLPDGSMCYHSRVYADADRLSLYIPFQVNHLHGQTEPVPRRMRATLTETEPMLFYANYQATAC